MSTAIRVQLKVPVAKSVASAVLWTIAAGLIASGAATGNTNSRYLRLLPISEEAKVAILWGLALFAVGLACAGFIKLTAVRTPPVLVIDGDHAVIPYGLALRKRAQVDLADLLRVAVEDYGGKDVLKVEWSGGKAYLPVAWFPDRAELVQVKRRLEAAVDLV